MGRYLGLIETYKQYLPVNAKTPRITLLEGNTPLIFAPQISRILGPKINLYLKYEGLNPTGSFKDRGMTLAISKAKEAGAKAVICASTGNTSASAAAYSARANLKCLVIIPEGAIALGKLAQALIHNACVVAIKGNFDQALEIVRQVAQKIKVEIVNSINPYRIEGQKTASFEICDYLGVPPYLHSLPVGNAGNITAYWKGYKEYYAAKKINFLPRMCGFQAQGSAPLVHGKIVKHPKTIATAIKIGNPASGLQAQAARDESQGLIEAVSDRQILQAYKLLAQKEGVFVEPASAASIAGLLKLKDQGFFQKIKKEINIVATLTGHGLKDPDRAINNVKSPQVVPARLDAVLAAAKL